MSGIIKTVGRHGVIYGIGDVLNKSVGFFLIPLYTRYLSASEYGTLELLDLTSFVIGIIAAMGIAQSVMRYYFEYPDQKRRDAVVSVGLISLWGVAAIVLPLLFLMSSTISSFIFDGPDYARFFCIVFSTLLVNLCNEIPMTLYRMRERPTQYVVVNFTRVILSVGLNVLLVVYFKLGVLGILLGSLGSSLLIGTFLIFHVVRSVHLSFDWQLARSMLNYSLPLVLSWLGMYVLNFSDRFFLQRLTGLADVGVYALAYKFGMIPNIVILAPFNLVWAPKRFEIASRPDARSIYSQVFTYFWVLEIFLGLGLCSLIREIVIIMVGPEFRAAYLYVPLIIGGYIAYGSYHFTQFGLLQARKTMTLSWCVLAAAAGNIMCNVILVPRYGLWGAATATLMSFLFLAWLVNATSQRHYHVQYDRRRVLHATILGAALYGLTWFVPDEPLWLAILLKVCVVGSYPLLLWKTGFPTAEEKHAVRDLVDRHVFGRQTVGQPGKRGDKPEE